MKNKMPTIARAACRACLLVLFISPFLCRAQDCFTAFYKAGMDTWKKDRNYEKALDCFNAAMTCIGINDPVAGKRKDSAMNAIKKMNKERIDISKETVKEMQKNIIRSLIDQAMRSYSEKQFKLAYSGLRKALDSAIAYKLPEYVREIRNTLQSTVFLNYYSNYIEFSPRYNLLAVLTRNPDKLYLADGDTFQYIDSIESKEINPDMVRIYGRVLLVLDKRDSKMIAYDLETKRSFVQTVPEAVLSTLSIKGSPGTFIKVPEKISVSAKANSIIFPVDSSVLAVVNYVKQASDTINVSPRLIWAGIKTDDDDDFLFIFLQNRARDSSFIQVYNLKERKSKGIYPITKFFVTRNNVIPAIVNGKKLVVYEADQPYENRATIRTYNLANHKQDTVLARTHTSWIDFTNRTMYRKPFYIIGDNLVYESTDSTIVFFNLNTMAAESQLNAQLDWPVFIPGKTLVDWPGENTLRFMDMQRQSQQILNEANNSEGQFGRYPHNLSAWANTYLLVNFNRQSLMYHLDSGKVSTTLPAEIKTYMFSPDQSKLVFVQKDAVKYYDLNTSTQRTIHKIEPKDENFYFSFISENKILIGVNTQTPRYAEKVVWCRLYLHDLSTGKSQQPVLVKDGWFITSIENRLVTLENGYFENQAIWIFMEEQDRETFQDYFFIKNCRVTIPPPY